MNSTQPHIAAGLCYYNTAKDMWNSLRQTYSQDKNISKILQVQQELLQMQQGDMDLTEYFTKLKFNYEKMNSLKSPCKHCLKSHMEQMIVVKFLAGLSSDYSAAKAQMLTGSDFPDLEEAFNRVNRLAVTLPPSTNNSQPSALASFRRGRSVQYPSRGRGRGRGLGGRGRLQCTYCSRLGHLEDKCWNKVGKPNNSLSTTMTSSSIPASNSQSISMDPKVNPTAASVDATSLKLTPVELELIMVHRSNVAPSTSSASTAITDSAFSAGRTPSNGCWIIDFVASRHFCGDASIPNLQKFYPSQYVRLADGRLSSVEGHGDVRLSPSLHVHEVLYTPEFPKNPLSVSKITKEMNCRVIFYTGTCVFQDL
ncbi:uncharacterized protein LOC126410010 [Nymphaea colorata]|uniref:uncharacterized protein LOC126410010 n=1 Tax=Nymphaea colorata TaxID=210225 RepID=UPI00214E6304|nr:uncharacterized protein LOC126410010 [Nymphaea colorata]